MKSKTHFFPVFVRPDKVFIFANLFNLKIVLFFPARKTCATFLLNSSKIYNFLIKSYHIIRITAYRNYSGRRFHGSERKADNLRVIYFTTTCCCWHLRNITFLPPNSCSSRRQQKNQIIIKKGHETRTPKKQIKLSDTPEGRKLELSPLFPFH